MGDAAVAVGQTVDFVVKSNAKTQTFFSDKLYQNNKVEAALREIIHNGRDSQEENGNRDEPLLIHMPTVAQPWLSVTDNGLGMSHAFMTTTFVTYSESTKDDPVKAREVVGRLGLGSKAPFAVADEFFVTSRFGGVKTGYRLYKSLHGNALDVLSSEPTDERNGVEVRWNVPSTKISEYQTALAKVLTYFLPLPTIQGVTKDFHPTPVYAGYEGDGYRVLKSGSGFDYNIKPRAIMGGIIYPIDVYQIPDLTEDQKALLSLKIDIDFPLGALEFGLGREALEYDPVKTRPAIKARAAEILKDMRSRIDADHRGFGTFYEAAQHLRTKTAKDETYAKVVRVVGARWRKRDIADGGFNLLLKDYPSLGGISYNFYRKYEGSATLSRTVTVFGVPPIAKPANHVEAGKFFVPAIHNLRIYRDDMETGAGVRFNDAISRMKAAGLFIALIRCNDADFAKLQAELEGVEIRSIQDIERPETKRYKASVRVLGPSYRQRGIIGKDTLVACEIDMDKGGLYVVTRINELQGMDARTFSERYEAVVKAGLFSDSQELFVVVPTTLAAKFEAHPKWQHAFGAFKARADKLLDAPDTATIAEKGRQGYGFTYDRDAGLHNGFHEVLEHLDPGHAWAAFNDRWTEYRKCEDRSRHLVGLAKAFGRPDLKADLGETLYQQFERLKDRYPLFVPSLKGAPSSRYYDADEKARLEAYWPQVAAYVTMIDGSDAPAPQAAPQPTGRRKPIRGRHGYERASKRRGDKAKASA